MSEHRAAVEWTRTTPGFAYDDFNRDHQVRFEDGAVVLAGDAGGDYGGRDAGIDPEALFAASLAACHMLSFLAIASRKRIVVDAYADAAVALVDKDAEGRPAVTRVTLKPRVTFGVEAPAARLAELHELAHRNCFVARAVKAEIVIEPSG